MTSQSVSASEFKAKCLALLDEVARTGEPLTVLKHGKPVAQIVPVVPRGRQQPQETLAGTMEILGDIVGPAVDPEEWAVEGT